MNYRLIVVTHGEHATLHRTLTSFRAMVTPEPTEAVVICDGPGPTLGQIMPLIEGAHGEPYRAGESDPARVRRTYLYERDEPHGFCTSAHRGWWHAIKPGPEHVFWLENDFEITQRLDLAELAAVLDTNTHLAQMALMRDAVNEQEKAAGGLFESRPGEYERSTLVVTPPDQPWFHAAPSFGRAHHLIADEVAPGEYPWLQHRAYFTTNPSLMRRDFMAENPWPDPAIVSDQCEGKFGIGLVQDGFRFGVWGTGEPWCKHIGVRDGFGY